MRSSRYTRGIWTGLHQFLPQDKVSDWKQDLYLMSQMKSARQGAATTVYAALDRELEGIVGGHGWSVPGGLCISGPVKPRMYTLLDPGYEEFAFDEAGERRLCRRHSSLLGAQSGGFGGVDRVGWEELAGLYNLHSTGSLSVDQTLRKSTSKSQLFFRCFYLCWSFPSLAASRLAGRVAGGWRPKVCIQRN